MAFCRRINFILWRRPGFKAFPVAICKSIFLLGFNIGTGSVTAMAKAGADYGMALLWALLLSCAVTWFMMDVFGRFAIVTGKTALHAFRRHLHPAVGIFFIVALGVNVSGSVMGVMGILADVSAVWLREVCGLSVPALALAILFSGLVFALFWVGRMDFFQKALAVMVAIMGAAFQINFIFLMPSVGETLSGIVPRMPEVGPGDGRDPHCHYDNSPGVGTINLRSAWIRVCRV